MQSVLVPVSAGADRPGGFSCSRDGRAPAGARPNLSAYAELRLLVLGRLFLHFLTGFLDSLAGRRDGVRSSLGSGITCFGGGVHGGIARSGSGITGGVSGLTRRSSGIGSSVLRCLNGFLLGAARDSQGSEGSGKSDLGVHQNVPRVMSMDV